MRSASGSFPSSAYAFAQIHRLLHGPLRYKPRRVEQLDYALVVVVREQVV